MLFFIFHLLKDPSMYMNFIKLFLMTNNARIFVKKRKYYFEYDKIKNKNDLLKIICRVKIRKS